MRATRLALMIALLGLFSAAVKAAGPKEVVLDLSGGIDGRGLLMAESDKIIYRVHLTARVDKNGEGNGTLDLDPTPNMVDEFGFPEYGPIQKPVKLDCSLKFVKKKKFLVGPAGPPPVEVEWRLFEVTGPKITSRFSLATEGTEWSNARFLVADKDGKGRYSVPVRLPPVPLPCHPGCFPAGTPIHVRGGVRSVDSLRVGDAVTTIGSDGTAGEGKVASVFATRNRLIEVRTDDGKTLLTTGTQPLSLAAGGLRAAGELKVGDRIQIWDGHERRAVAVLSVVATGRETQVFNLVLSDPVLFVAGGFLARSKPPLTAPAVTTP